MSHSKPPVRPEDSLAKMIAALKEKTGKTLEEWRIESEQAGWTTHGEMMKGLKDGHSVSHAYANQIALNLRAAPSSETDPIAELFAKRERAKEIYELLLSKLMEFGPDVDLAPKKGYVSVRRSKQFAVLQPAAARLDIGIQLKGLDPFGRLEPSGSFNPMLSHRVRVSAIEEVDAELLGWLKIAYEAA